MDCLQLTDDLQGCRTCEFRDSKFYSPNIEHNLIGFRKEANYYLKAEGRCVKDCSLEDGNYANPETVVPLWRVLADYDIEDELMDEYNIDEMIHNLQECICAEGYFMDDDYKCRSCRDIHFDCTTCINSETCTVCGSDHYMLTPVENDYVTCQPKVEHCETPMY